MDQNFARRLYLGGFFILLFSLFYYQIIKGDYYLERARNNYLRALPLPSLRGSIFDRNAVALAYDRPAFNLAVVPYEIKKKKGSLFSALAQALGVSVNTLKDNYEKRRVNSFSPVDLIATDKRTAILLKEKFNEDIIIDPKPARYYRQADEFAHLLGYVKEASSYPKLKEYGYRPKERAGFLGIEQYYDSYLRGEDGGKLIEVSAGGKIVGFLGKRSPLSGKDIYLTVDSRIQKVAYEALGGQAGSAIMIDSRKGEVIALASSPSFDPNAFVNAKDLNRFLGSRKHPMLNRAIQATYPLGSVFKPLVALAGLEEKKITAATTFFCRGKINLGKAEFKCWKVHGNENLSQGLAHSCNVYFYNLGLILGGKEIARWAEKAGLNSLSGIDLPYEKKGFVPYPAWKEKVLRGTWFAGDTLNFSIGQGYLAATPLEVLLAMNIFADQGYLVKPYILKKVGGIDSGFTSKKYLKISPDNLREVKKGLIAAVESEEGTAHLLKKLNLKIAGKTGTAQNKGKAHGWFAGFFPYDRPRYTFCFFLENAGSSFQALRASYRFLKQLKENNLITPLSKE